MDSLNSYVSIEVFKYKKLKFGQGLYIVGNIPEIGNWDPMNSVRLNWTEGNNWSAIINIPAPSDFEYKYIVSWHDLPHKDFIIWESGPNSKMSVLSRDNFQENGLKKLMKPVIKASEVSVMSFNLRYANSEDCFNGWEFRKDIVANVMKLYDCDFICIQEGLIDMIKEMEYMLPLYSSYGRYRGNKEDEDESVMIFYKFNKWFIDNAGTFWLSDTLNIPGSKTFGNDIPRICTWIKFRNIFTLESIYVYNCHLDHESLASQIKSADLISKHMNDKCGDIQNVILTGDFNVTEESETLKIFKNKGLQLKDTCNINTFKERSKGTFHNWSGKHDGMKIDYILSHPKMEVKEFKIIRDNSNNRYPSDHYPIMAKLNLV